jgi:predicted transcriptional regulator
MREVLASLKPYYYYLVGEGIKEVEVRKSIPKLNDWDKKVFFYMSKEEKSFAKIPKEYQEKYRRHFGKVGLQFVCDRIDGFYLPYPAYFHSVQQETQELIKNACLTMLETHHYIGTRKGYSWRISDLKIYEKPKELSEFFTPIGKRPSYMIERPPQSWCYVKEVEE